MQFFVAVDKGIGVASNTTKGSSRATCARERASGGGHVAVTGLDSVASCGRRLLGAASHFSVMGAYM